jgi:hypothetical protein
MRRRRLHVLALVAVLAWLVPAVAAARSPRELLTAILAAGRAQHSVHYVSDARLGPLHVVQVADVGPTTGIQRITYTRAGKAGKVTVIVSGRTAYVRGDVFALVNYMGFKPAAAATYAHRWVSIPHSDRDYATVAGDVTLPSVMNSLKGPGRPLAAASATVAGRRVVGVQWRTIVGGKPVVATLYAQASGKPLPVQERVTRGSSLASLTFGHWNEALHVGAPKSAIPISTTGLE